MNQSISQSTIKKIFAIECTQSMVFTINNILKYSRTKQKRNNYREIKSTRGKSEVRLHLVGLEKSR